MICRLTWEGYRNVAFSILMSKVRKTMENVVLSKICEIDRDGLPLVNSEEVENEVLSLEVFPATVGIEVDKTPRGNEE